MTTWEYLVAATAIGLIVYLFVTLIRPEKF